MIKIDVKDRKLLYYLSLNSRESLTRLAKLVGLSKNGVKYRIERLRSLGIIVNFCCLTNLGACGYKTFIVLIKFNEDIYSNESILEYFKSHKLIDWAAVLSGDWDLLIEAVYTERVTDFLDDLIGKFGNKINKFQVFFSYDIIKVEHLIRDMYDDLGLEELPSEQRAYKMMELDQKDRRILAQLNSDSTLSYVEMSKRLGLTIDIIRYRVAQLKKSRVIIKFFPEISLHKLGYISYLFIVRLRNISKERINSLKASIRQNRNITYAFFDSISFSLVCSCAFRSGDEIDQLSRGLRKDYSDIIDSQSYLVFKDHFIFNLFPKGLLGEKNAK